MKACINSVAFNVNVELMRKIYLHFYVQTRLEKNQWFCRTVKDVNDYIGADYNNQTPIDFDWYNSHPYQRTTRIIKNFLTEPFFPHDMKVLVELRINA